MTNYLTLIPEELVDKWCQEYSSVDLSLSLVCFIAGKAAQWGADQELKSCLDWLAGNVPPLADEVLPEEMLKEARRPKTLTAKQQAQHALAKIHSAQHGVFDGKPFQILEQIIGGLPDD